MKLRNLYVVFLMFVIGVTSAQNFSLLNNEKSSQLKFKFINNLIIIPIEVNGVELSFILDSGVGTPILFNLSNRDSLGIKNVREILINGLGEGEPVKAYRSTANSFKIGDAYSSSHDLFLVMDKKINFSPRLGIPVHGIIGYDVFRDLVVEIKYSKRKIVLHDPEKYMCKKCDKYQNFDLEIVHKKAYVNLSLDNKYATNMPVKLLIDTGSSDALWLFENADKNLLLPEQSFEDYLGRGLNGSIFGDRAKIEKLHVGALTLKNTIVAFPDELYYGSFKNLNGRDGSIGGEILKRFNIIFDYSNAKMSLKKNGNFKAPFLYNVSGIELQHNGVRYVRELESNFNGIVSDDKNTNGAVTIALDKRYKIALHPAFEIAEVRKNSPAELAGLKEGDVILSVDGKRTYSYRLQEVSALINKKIGKDVRLLIERDGQELVFSFRLKKSL